MKHLKLFTLLLVWAFSTSVNAQNKVNPPKDGFGSVRDIKQDKKGNIWLAAWQDVFKYDGNAYTNITGKLGTDGFVSVLEDRKGNFWFGTMGSGVYYYDGRSFKNFTTKEGLVNNRVSFIYEDKAGNIWLGANGGVSVYNGKSFRNFIINGEAVTENATAQSDPKLATGERFDNEVTAILEDRNGKFWLSTSSNTFIYDGKTFTVFKRDKRPFKNVRSIIEDRKGNKWLGGNDGLWRYDGNKFTFITADYIAYVYEDRKGNIWTSSESTKGQSSSGFGDSSRTVDVAPNPPKWVVSRYDEKSLMNIVPIVTELRSKLEENKGTLSGILEANDGSIWVGASTGVYRYEADSIK